MTKTRQALTTAQAILVVCLTGLFAFVIWRAIVASHELIRNGICISEPSKYDICRVAASNGVAFFFGASFIGRNHYQDAYQALVQLFTAGFLSRVFFQSFSRIFMAAFVLYGPGVAEDFRSYLPVRSLSHFGVTVTGGVK